MLLAMVILPMILRALFLARRERFVEHRRIARILWPMWIYVCVTGISVYFILYHFAA